MSAANSHTIHTLKLIVRDNYDHTFSLSNQGRRRQLLADYQRKRDFNKTTEPPAKHARSTDNRFLSSRTTPGVCTMIPTRSRRRSQSWAVTKIPTWIPPSAASLSALKIIRGIRELQGTFLKANRAGHVEIWDRGTYENLSRWPLPRALAQGKIEIDLHGQKLKGKFALIRIAGEKNRENWLLVKMKDDSPLTKKRPDPSRSLRKQSHQNIKGTTSFRPSSSTELNRERESGLQKVPKKVAPRCFV